MPVSAICSHRAWVIRFGDEQLLAWGRQIIIDCTRDTADTLGPPHKVKASVEGLSLAIAGIPMEGMLPAVGSCNRIEDIHY